MPKQQSSRNQLINKLSVKTKVIDMLGQKPFKIKINMDRQRDRQRDSYCVRLSLKGTSRETVSCHWWRCL